MTRAQDQLYWREWAAVVRTCKAHGWPVPDRHELHASALGSDKSHLDFTNADFDLVLAQFRAISQPDNLGAQLRAQDQPRARLLYSIRRLAPEAYSAKVARDKFGTADLDELGLGQLAQLHITLAARARRKNLWLASASAG
ncbi:MAG TPA: hypothetical protein P5038_13440 [Candidatus Paceibacterota bacterium]|nr:hypothetical protein [Candidatus Paceibacterota bacterium]